MSALGDVIVSALRDFLRSVFNPIKKGIHEHGNEIMKSVVGTPHPNTVFSRPMNDVWPAIYDYYWDAIIPLALLLWALMIGLVIFLESTSHLFGSYHRSKLKKRAFAGLLGILSWWWMAALSLQFMDGLADYIAPDLTNVALFETLSFGAMGLLGLVITLSVDLALFLLIGLLYFAREVVLYLFVLLMPILIALWIPGVGPFTLSSQFMKRLAGFYVPFLFMTIPVAVLFQLGKLLGHSFGFTPEGIGAWLAALIIPFLAVASPFVLFWQAGALLFMADRMSHRISAQQARQRAGTVHEQGARAAHGGRNLGRGLRGHGARTRDGDTLFGSGDSRANRAGLHFRSRAQDAKAQANQMHQNGAEFVASRAADFRNLRNGTDSTREPSALPSGNDQTTDNHDEHSRR